MVATSHFSVSESVALSFVSFCFVWRPYLNIIIPSSTDLGIVVEKRKWWGTLVETPKCQSDGPMDLGDSEEQEATNRFTEICTVEKQEILVKGNSTVWDFKIKQLPFMAMSGNEATKSCAWVS